MASSQGEVTSCSDVNFETSQTVGIGFTGLAIIFSDIDMLRTKSSVSISAVQKFMIGKKPTRLPNLVVAGIAQWLTLMSSCLQTFPQLEMSL